MIWKGAITPGGPTHTFNGTADSIYADILKINPKYDASTCATEGPVQIPHRLNKRDNVSDSGSHSTIFSYSILDIHSEIKTLFVFAWEKSD
jgi:hypothetical protein